MASIDICMTATLRPEILDITLSSFCRYLFNQYPHHEYELIINIDCAGARNNSTTYKDVLDVCYKYFLQEQIIYRVSEQPHFPTAFKWVWQQANADYVFHLEDDWELLREVDLEAMLFLMFNTPELAILRLSSFVSTENSIKNWNKFFNWNGLFYECPPELIGGLAFSGHPSLIKFEWIAYVREYLNGRSNPEKQIKWRDTNIGPYLNNFKYGVYSERNIGPTIRDLGRRWMIKNNLVKNGCKAHFINWAQV